MNIQFNLIFRGYIIIDMAFKHINVCWLKHIHLVKDFLSKCEITSPETLSPIQNQN